MRSARSSVSAVLAEEGSGAERATATSASPLRTRPEPSVSRTTSSGESSGTGGLRLTSAAPSKKLARTPVQDPPLPLANGPLNLRGIETDADTAAVSDLIV